MKQIQCIYIVIFSGILCGIALVVVGSTLPMGTSYLKQVNGTILDYDCGRAQKYKISCTLTLNFTLHNCLEEGTKIVPSVLSSPSESAELLPEPAVFITTLTNTANNSTDSSTTNSITSDNATDKCSVVASLFTSTSTVPRIGEAIQFYYDFRDPTFVTEQDNNDSAKSSTTAIRIIVLIVSVGSFIYTLANPRKCVDMIC